MKSARPHRSVLHYDTDDALVQALEGLSCSCQDEQQSRSTQQDWRLAKYDTETTKSLSLEEEAARLRTLRTYQILETEPESVFDTLTAKAMETFGVSWSAVSMVDLGRQWYKSLAGNDSADDVMHGVVETSRQDAFCAHTILLKGDNKRVLEVRDATLDDRFSTNPSVTGGPKFHFYAGAPLISLEGHVLGAFCIMDTEPRPSGLTESERGALLEMAAQTVKHMVDRQEDEGSSEEDRKPTAEVGASSQSDAGASKKRTATQVQTANRERRLQQSSSAEIRRKESFSSQEESGPKKRSRSPSSPTQIPVEDRQVPDPKSSTADPSAYLVQLVEAMFGVQLNVKPARDLSDFFEKIREEQLSAYTIEIVSAARENNVDKIKEIYSQNGRAALDCFNRFGEGLLNLACRRGFTEMTRFLLHEVKLDVRVCDDYGRTPLHDACWHPEPQLQICTWILELDPSLFLVADRRGYTPFQYARPGDWHIWRDFLFQNRQHFEALVRPEMIARFT